MNQRKAGAILSYVNILALILVGLLYTPLMLRLLGRSEYGLYALIGSFVGYLSVLDMGLGNTIIRYISINRVQGSKTREAELNTLFLLVYCGLGCFAAAIGAWIYFHLDSIFGASLTPGELDRARLMTALLVFNIAVSFPLGLFSAVMTVYERFIFLRVSNILRVIINPLIVLPLLYSGYGSVMMVIVSTVLNLSCLLANAWYCFRYLHIQFRLGIYPRIFLWEIAVYSFFIFLNVVMDKIYYSTGQFILGIVSGTQAVAVYAVAIQIILMYMQFSTAISSVVFPKITRMVAGGADGDRLTDVMVKIGRLQYIVIAYIVIMFILLGRDFLRLWAGNEYLGAYPIVLLLMTGLFTPLIQNAGISILQAENRNKFRMIVYILCAASSVFISIPLARIYGGFGCAIGTGLSMIISTGFIMNWYYQKKIGIHLDRFWGNILRMTGGAVLFAGCAYGICHYLLTDINWITFIAAAVLCTLVYVPIMYLFSFNAYEKSLCQTCLIRFGVKI